MKKVFLFVTFAALCGAQTTVNGGSDYNQRLKVGGSVSEMSGNGGDKKWSADRCSAFQPSYHTGGHGERGCNAGDVLYVSSATADGVQTRFTTKIVYTVD